MTHTSGRRPWAANWQGSHTKNNSILSFMRQNYSKTAYNAKKKCVNLRKKVMSDGNFNRALLPSTPYRSGYNMGRSRGIHAARKAMEHVLRTALPQLEEEAVQGLLEAFDQEMKETT